MPGELANKAPTCIEYCSESPQTVKNWGFKCDWEDRSLDVKEFFKLHLAPLYRDLHPGSFSRQDAQRWFRDYVHCVYQHVVAHFSTSIPQFARRKVEFLFSVPTTWKDVRMVEETRRLLEDAVDASSPNHRAFIGLTEAEAAAVYAGNEHYQADDTILVCDSGGGTTVNAPLPPSREYASPNLKPRTSMSSNWSRSEETRRGSSSWATSKVHR